MGSSDSRFPDHVCSTDPLRFLPSLNEAIVSKDRSTVSFPPYSNSNALTAAVDLDCDRARAGIVCVQLGVHVRGDSQVVLGFGSLSSSAKSDGSVVFWEKRYANVTSGEVIADDGQVIPSTMKLSTNSDGHGRIKCCLNLQKGLLHYTRDYTSPTKPDIRISSVFSINGEGFPPPEQPIWPMVGVVGGGDGKVTVELLPRPSQPCHEPSALPLQCLRFDTSTAFGPLDILDDGLVVRRGNIESNCCIAIDRAMNEGIHQWKLEVVKDIGFSLCLGIAKHPLNISRDYENSRRQIFHHPNLWLWRSFKGYLYANGEKIDKTLEPIGWVKKNTVTVEFELNLNTGELEIKRNDKSMGVAFTDIEGPVCPVVVFHAGYEKEVRIIPLPVAGGATGSNLRPSLATFDRSMTISPPCHSLVPLHSSPTTPHPVAISHTQLLPSASVPPSAVSDAHETMPLQQSLCSSIARQSSHGSTVCFADPPEQYNDCLIVLDNRQTLQRTKSGNSYCLLTKSCCRPGSYRWSFMIERDEKAGTCIGITAEPVREVSKKEQSIFESPSMILLCRSFDGRISCKGKVLQQKQFDKFWYDNSEIELTLDFDSNALQYSINNVNQGLVFLPATTEDISYRPVVAFYGDGEKRVTLLKFETLEKSSKQIVLTDRINNLNSVCSPSDPQPLPAAQPVPTSSGSSTASVMECIVCSVQNNNVEILPCKHVVYCPAHAIVGNSCVICNSIILEVKNIFL